MDWAWKAARSYMICSLQELKAMDKTRFGLQAVNLGGGCTPLDLHHILCKAAGGSPTRRCQGWLSIAGTLITTGLMIWKFLVLITGSDSPVRTQHSPSNLRPTNTASRAGILSSLTLQVVVVLSGSMEPAFYRGDILFLYKGSQPIRAGEVVVFDINGRDIPIVHRVIKVHEQTEGRDIQASRKTALPDDGCGRLPITPSPGACLLLKDRNVHTAVHTCSA